MIFWVIILLRSFINTFFMGFGVLIPLFALIKTSNLKTLHAKQHFILLAVKAIRIAGIVYELTYLCEGYQIYREAIMKPERAPLLFSAYTLISTFYQPLACLVITQLFWIKKVYMKKAALIMLPLILITVPLWLEALAMLSLQNTDYFQPDWLGMLSYLLFNAVSSAALFFIIIFIFMQIGTRLKMRKAIQQL